MGCAAREVTFYLAVASSSSSRSLPSRLSASLSRIRRRATPGPPAPRSRVPIHVQELIEDLDGEGPQPERHVQLAEDTSLEQRRGVGQDPLKPHRRTVARSREDQVLGDHDLQHVAGPHLEIGRDVDAVVDQLARRLAQL